MIYLVIETPDGRHITVADPGGFQRFPLKPPFAATVKLLTFYEHAQLTYFDFMLICVRLARERALALASKTCTPIAPTQRISVFTYM